MKNYKIILISLALCLLCGCGAIYPVAYNYNRSAQEEVIISTFVQVHLVTSRAQIPYSHPDVKGAATSSDIWILATPRKDGTYFIDYWLLGHEFAHVLHWQDPRIANPDGLILQFDATH